MPADLAWTTAARLIDQWRQDGKMHAGMEDAEALAEEFRKYRPFMARETLEMVDSTLNELEREQFLNPLPHLVAKHILMNCQNVRDIITGQEFDGATIFAHCEQCLSIILTSDTGGGSDDDGGHFCADCVERWGRDEKNAKEEPPMDPAPEGDDNLESHIPPIIEQ